MSFLRLCIGVFVLGVSVSSYAGDISMRGFASIVAGQTFDSDESLYGYDDGLNFSNDSLVALQFNTDMGDGLSATVQMVGRGAQSYDVDVEWAYITYEFNDAVQLSAGRIRVPFYRYSDYLDVRYTYPWVKVPQTVYGFELPGYDGVSLLVNSSFGSWDSMLQIVYGRTNKVDFDGAIVSIDELLGFNWTMTRDWLSLRAAYLPLHISNQNPGFSGLAQLAGAAGQSQNVDTSRLVEYILADDDPAYFGAFSVGMDYNDWLMDFEYIDYGGDVVNPVTKAYYLSFGKRIGSFTPFISVSNQKTDDPQNDAFNLIPAALSDYQIPEAGNATMSQVLNGFYTLAAVDTDLTLVGVRYDFHSAAALKVEYATQDDINNDTNSLIRFGIDLIF